MFLFIPRQRSFGASAVILNNESAALEPCLESRRSELFSVIEFSLLNPLVLSVFCPRAPRNRAHTGQ